MADICRKNNKINNNKVKIFIKVLKARKEILDYIDLSSSLSNLINSSDIELNAKFINFINNNTDFVSF